MLELKNIKVTVDNNEIIKNVDLSVKKGELHALICLLYTSDAADD